MATSIKPRIAAPVAKPVIAAPSPRTSTPQPAAPRGYRSESSYAPAPAPARKAPTAGPSPEISSRRKPPPTTQPTQVTQTANGQEYIGRYGDDDTKRSRYYNPAKNKPGLLSRENRVNQHPNIPKPLKEALLKGMTMQELAANPELSKLYSELPDGSDASARASSLAIANGLRDSFRRSARQAIEAAAQQLLAVINSVR